MNSKQPLSDSVASPVPPPKSVTQKAASADWDEQVPHPADTGEEGEATYDTAVGQFDHWPRGKRFGKK